MEQVNTDEAPVKYQTTWISIVVVMVFTMVAALALRFILARKNTTRNTLVGTSTQEHVANEKDEDGKRGQLRREEEELTDGKDMRFRYTL